MNDEVMMFENARRTKKTKKTGKVFDLKKNTSKTNFINQFLTNNVKIR